MSAIICGKRSFFEELPNSPPIVSKRIRCSSSSPVRFSPPSLIDRLSVIFPEMDKQVLERALEKSSDDLELAIKSLCELRLGSSDVNLCSYDGLAPEANVQHQQNGVTINGDGSSAEDSSASNTLPINGEDWVELFVREMTSASNMDDARARASRALEVLEKSIISRVGVGAQSLSQENIMLKEQMKALIQENTILKRAVSIQFQRQKEYEDRNQELQNLKQMLSQYQEKLTSLEVNNYALTMHLRQAQQSSSIAGRFHPDVF